MDASLLQQVRSARRRFLSMASAYGLGVFNDSFFRQSVMLLAMPAGQEAKQGWVMAIFALPYILFASPAGWLADRFSKGNVVIAAKALELVAMILGAAGICTGNWILLLSMVFTMAMQSCLFSPALNGSIPELYPALYVTRANALLKVVVTVMILGGVAASGPVLAVARVGGDGAAGQWLERTWNAIVRPLGLEGIPPGRLLVGAGVVAISLAGLIVSLGVPRRKPAAPEKPFPWTGPLETFREFSEIRRDRLLLLVVVANVTAWFAGALLIQMINLMATHQLGTPADKAMASYMVASQLVGLAVGGLIGSRIAHGRPWYRLLPGGMLVLSGVLGAMALLPQLEPASRKPAAYGMLAVIGFVGGMILIPCEGFVQVRAAGHCKGAVIASVNFAVFSGILISGPVANGLYWLVLPTTGIALAGWSCRPPGSRWSG